MKIGILDQLQSKKKFHVVCADITPEQVNKNDPYVLRVDLPRDYQFIEVTQIASPAACISPLLASSQIAYSFLIDAKEQMGKPYNSRLYITSLFSEVEFPWSNPSSYVPEAQPRIICRVLGITTHSGVPILHTGVELQYVARASGYDEFEEELVSAGYKLIGTKTYGAAAALVDMFKSVDPPVQNPSAVEPG